MAKDEKPQPAPQQQPMSFTDYITVLRNQIVLSYDGAKEIAIKNFDDITKKLVEQIQVNQEAQAQAKKDSTPLVTPDKEKPNPRK